MYKKFDKSAKEWQLFQDFWRLCQQYWEPEDKDSPYWGEVVAAVDDFTKKYDGDIFARKIVLTFLETLELKAQNRK